MDSEPELPEAQTQPPARAPGTRKPATPRSAAQKPVTPKAATPKAATPKAATPKAATPKAATPKAATPKAPTPRAATPRATTPKTTTRRASAPQATPATESAVTEPAAVAAAATDAAVTSTPDSDAETAPAKRAPARAPRAPRTSTPARAAQAATDESLALLDADPVVVAPLADADDAAVVAPRPAPKRPATRKPAASRARATAAAGDAADVTAAAAAQVDTAEAAAAPAETAAAPADAAPAPADAAPPAVAPAAPVKRAPRAPRPKAAPKATPVREAPAGVEPSTPVDAQSDVTSTETSVADVESKAAVEVGSSAAVEVESPTAGAEREVIEAVPSAESPAATPSETEVVLRITGLVKRFGDTTAVAGIDLEIEAGSFFGIVGPNGAGKTTTLSMVTGLLRPDAGSVTVHGADVWTNPVVAKRTMGVLPDRLRLFDRLTGAQLLYYSGILHGLDKAVVRSRSADLAAAFGLEDSLNRLVTDYSAGMTKKIALAAAMIHSPRLLVLDEPFESVDPVSAANVIEILQKYVAAGGTVVMSSHTMGLIERICDSVAVVVNGAVLATGTMAEVRRGKTLEDRFVELAGGRKAAEGMEWLHKFSD